MSSRTARPTTAGRRTEQLIESARRRRPRRWAIRGLPGVLDDARVVAVDYFGTVVTRTVPPWYVKLLAARRLAKRLGVDLEPEQLYRVRLDLERQLCGESLALGHDADFRLDDLAPGLMERVARSGRIANAALPSVSDFTALMIDAEVESELLVQRVDHDLVRVLRAGPDTATLVLVSDFYLPQPHFGRLLRHHSLTDLFDAVFISCETGRTKKSGRMFDLLAERLEADPTDVLVIGDDPISDGQRARAAGMRAYVLPRKTWERRKQANAEVVAKNVERRLERLMRPADDADLFPAMALTLYAFICRLHGRLRRAGASEAFFMAREGQLLSRLFCAYEEEERLPSTQRIEARYLMTSRRATYLPSLPPIGATDFRSLLEPERRATVGEFVATFGFDPATVGQLVMKLTGDPSGAAPVDVEAVLGHPAFVREYERRRGEQRSAILEYLGEQVDLAATRTMYLVDVGWKGTTQDQLARLLASLRDLQLVGCYVGLLTSAPPEPPDSKIGILFHNQPQRSICLEVFTQFKAMFELLLSADHGSVRGYERTPDGAVPIVDHSPAEHSEYEQYLSALQVRFEERFRRICRELARSVIDDDELVDLAARHHARMVFRPSAAEIRFFERLPVYNAGQRLQQAQGTRPAVTHRRTLGSLANRFRPHRLVGGGGWPPLRMRAAGVGWLRFPYGWYKLGVQRRRAHKARSQRRVTTNQ
jgi:FMN phosphatase YigB (HAD superfamily)